MCKPEILQSNRNQFCIQNCYHVHCIDQFLCAKFKGGNEPVIWGQLRIVIIIAIISGPVETHLHVCTSLWMIQYLQLCNRVFLSTLIYKPKFIVELPDHCIKYEISVVSFLLRCRCLGSWQTTSWKARTPVWWSKCWSYVEINGKNTQCVVRYSSPSVLLKEFLLAISLLIQMCRSWECWERPPKIACFDV